MGSAEFFGWVDESLSPRMAELGYHRIGGFENDQPPSRGLLTRPGAPSPGADSAGRGPFSIAEGRVDWDPFSDTGPLSGSQVRRRLADVGRAVADFARSQRAPPSTS